MKNRNKGRILATGMCMALLLSGCKIGGKEFVISNSLDNREVFQIGEDTCGIKEAKVYLVNYQNIYGTAYGLDLWEHNFGDDSLETYVKDITMKELVQILGMNQLAVSLEMELTEEELGMVDLAAASYYDSLSEDELSYLGVSEGDIEEFYSHYALAQKLYNSLTSEVNEEVSDDEARVMEVMQIYVTDEAKATEVANKLAAGEDFASIANNYNELSTIQTYLSRGECPEELENIAFQMDNQEISGIIKVEGGYYFIRCLNIYDEELTEANKANIVEKREKEAFDDVYNAYIETLTSHINEEVWNGIEVDTTADITTNSFFEIFEQYCGDI